MQQLYVNARSYKQASKAKAYQILAPKGLHPSMGDKFDSACLAIAGLTTADYKALCEYAKNFKDVCIYHVFEEVKCHIYGV